MSKVFAILGCGLALAACTASGDLMKTATPTVPLQFESEPPGAEVKTSSGLSCRTPCALAVPAADFSATYDLKGFQPQTVPVRLMPPEDARIDQEFISGGTAPRFDPNPVYAVLTKASQKKRAPKRPRVARTPIDDAEPSAPQAQREPSSSFNTAPPPPSTSFGAPPPQRSAPQQQPAGSSWPPVGSPSR